MCGLILRKTSPLAGLSSTSLSVALWGARQLKMGSSFYVLSPKLETLNPKP